MDEFEEQYQEPKQNGNWESAARISAHRWLVIAVVSRDILIIAPRQDEARIRATYAANFDSIETLPAARFALTGRGEIAIPLYLGHTLKHWP
jgi:hypothetical protein